ncbi:hypothetical protein HLH44_21190 [Gluconacetobacter sp. 1c LMG 22058]|uniref:Uncharacterized protein n=1 Tax=Gluconacetobacter dulcium TaxID=2729096 RepID=A0A7W4K3W5_9PROT|nr:hypothetical protein [Gluconacetobacter dulcium]MBB2199902.1 hypothetical protein [Gluconacetobacter dulcium]
MAEYRVKIGFWLRAYDSFTIDASTPDEAIDIARREALQAIESTEKPEHVETDARREGVIVYIDRVGAPVDQATIAEDIAFDDDRIHPATASAPDRGRAIAEKSG